MTEARVACNDFKVPLAVAVGDPEALASPPRPDGACEGGLRGEPGVPHFRGLPKETA